MPYPGEEFNQGWPRSWDFAQESGIFLSSSMNSKTEASRSMTATTGMLDMPSTRTGPQQGARDLMPRMIAGPILLAASAREQASSACDPGGSTTTTSIRRPAALMTRQRSSEPFG